MRIFVLPKTASPHTMVVLSLEPPIRKGQTYYPHVLCQFPSGDEMSVSSRVPYHVALGLQRLKCSAGRLARRFVLGTGCALVLH